MIFKLLVQVDSSTESAEAACNILSQLVNCSIKTLGLISTAKPSFMNVSKVLYSFFFLIKYNLETIFQVKLI